MLFQAKFISGLQNLIQCVPLDMICKLFSALAEWPLVSAAILGCLLVRRSAAYRLVGIVLISIAVNWTLKNLFQVDRPFVTYPLLKSVVTESGFSFPSGHSQMATVFWLWWALESRSNVFTVFCFCVPILVGFSRVYFGVHYPSDVFIGWAVGLSLIIWWDDFCYEMGWS